MRRNEFIKLYETQKERVEKSGKKDPQWFLGFVEGFRNQKLTGYQIGALVHLLMLPDEKAKSDPEESPEQGEYNETDSGESRTFSIPGIM